MGNTNKTEGKTSTNGAGNQSTTETRDFVNSWNSHIDDFNRLRFSLDERHWDELDSILDQLKQQVENAVVNRVFKEARRNGVEVAN